MAGQPEPGFAELLRQLRPEAGLTQEDLAQAAGLGLRTVSDLERGIHRTAHQDTARLLTAALGLPGPVHGSFAAAARGRASADQVLAARSAALAASAVVAAYGPVPAAVPVPRELPADVSGFTGRDVELAELDFLLPSAAGEQAGAGGPVVISAVSGTAGVGKTALAVRWAHRVSDAFPDGQLYVNLRGYDLDQPLSAGEALAGFLQGLGMAGPDIPLKEAERAAPYRSLALETARRAGDTWEQARALARLGDVCRYQGQYGDAASYDAQALNIYQAMGARGGQADALNGTGETVLATGQPSRACTCHAAALAKARQAGDRYQQARAHHGLARAYNDAGQAARAQQHWQHARQIYVSLEVPEADTGVSPEWAHSEV